MRAVLTAILSFALLLTAAPLVEAGGGVRLTGLQVEKKTQPIGIDVAQPRFSWITESSGRGVEQVSYRLRVDGVWDSGVVRSRESANVPYGGPALRSATDHTWRVDVVTTHGRASASATFRTGLSHWGASKWIGNPEQPDVVTDLTFAGARWIWTPEAPAEERAFRTTRVSPSGKAATRAEILITADDAYQLWVNGSKVGETEAYENGWQESAFYEADLVAERNVFAVRASNGPGSPAGLIAVVRVTYVDGTTSTFTTGSDWKLSSTVPANFEQPDFDDSGWSAATELAVHGSGPWGDGVRLPAPDPLPAPLLRREFQVAPGVRDATLYLAAGGYANVSLNGKPATDEVLSPGFTDYDDTVQYTAVDLTRSLHTGTNALGMELGRGFYGMTGGNVWRWESPPWHAEPTVRAVLHIEYKDGRVERLGTDETWRIHDGPTVLDDLYMGETYDARLVHPGYDAVGFDDSSWSGATVAPGPRGVLVNQRQQPIRVTESLPAVSITSPAEGVHVVKFPRVIAGGCGSPCRGRPVPLSRPATARS